MKYKMNKKVSDYIAEFIEKIKVKHVFMLPGGGAMHLVDSLGNSGIQYICCQHEQAASVAAEAYGQHTNHLGVAMVTSGPGATNAITGVTAGWIDSTPMLIISGQAKTADLVGDTGVRQRGSQEVQIIEMVKPITKYAAQIIKPEEIRYHLERAYMAATTGRKGPVWLSIPLDIQAAVINDENLEGYYTEKNTKEIEDSTIQHVYDLIRKSNKPLILAGNAVITSDSVDRFLELVQVLEIPVMTTWKSMDMMEEEHQLYVGHPGIMGDRGANFIIQDCDLLLVLGSRLDTSITAFNEKDFARKAKKIIVDIDRCEIDKLDMDIELKIVGEMSDFMDKMLRNVGMMSNKIDRRRWILNCRRLREVYPVIEEKYSNIKGYVSAYYFIGKLSELLDKDDIIVPESSGGAAEITCQAFKIKKGQKMKHAAGLGSMGFGLPYAIGACLANDRKRTILINGDGAFQLNIQELETLYRLQLPVKIFIWNNGGYASIRAMQNGNFNGHLVASDDESGQSMPNISAIAEAYGFKTYKISSNDDVENMLKIILQEDVPIICEVMVLPNETVSPRIKAIKNEDGSMVSMPLDKMWPYLDE